MIDPKTYPSRTTSSTTRIESNLASSAGTICFCFQNYIQHNKDWKPLEPGSPSFGHLFQNYIQHNKDWKICLRTSRQPLPCFQNYIQHNKDWKWLHTLTLHVVVTLPELHPAQQGLKVFDREGENGEAHHFQNYIQHNKDWKILSIVPILSDLRLPELHPAQQGLKDGLCRTLCPFHFSSRTTSSTTRIERFN